MVHPMDEKETRNDQSQSTRIFANKNNVNKIEQSVRSISRQSEISPSNSSRIPQLNSKPLKKKKLSDLNSEITEMSRETFYHWGATGDNGENLEENKKPENKNNCRATKCVIKTRNFTKTVRPPLPKDDIRTFTPK